MSNRTDAGCALAIAVLVHVLAIWLALREVPLRSVPQVRMETALEVVWIRRAAKPPALEGLVGARMPVSPALVRARSDPAVSPRQADTPPTRPVAPVHGPSDPGASANTDPVAGAVAVETTRRPLDLRVPEPMVDFNRNRIARRPPPIEAYQDRMTLRFSDRSFGGTMQRMVKSEICRELRRGLRTAGGGAYGVIESMREHGCPI